MSRIRHLLAACVLVACHHTPTISLAYHQSDAGSGSPASGQDFLSTGTIAVGLAVAIDVSSEPPSAIDVTSSDSAVLEVLPTTTGAFVLVAHEVGTATLTFVADGDVAKTMPVNVVAQ